MKDTTDPPAEQPGEPAKPIFITRPSDVPKAVQLAQRRKRRPVYPPESLDAFCLPICGEAVG